IIQIDQENNILYVSGAVPGARNGLITICGDGELKIFQPTAEKAEEAKSVEAAETGSEPKTDEAVAVKATAENNQPVIIEAPGKA
ncbi:hypothetical protein HY797_02190, partial [Candidatus Falkowbacteria bacterium]|nr:hypothetical protein [Candidatus Falkowbacteria bacterium]